jgi:hypothetical protein
MLILSPCTMCVHSREEWVACGGDCISILTCQKGLETFDYFESGSCQDRIVEEA